MATPKGNGRLELLSKGRAMALAWRCACDGRATLCKVRWECERHGRRRQDGREGLCDGGRVCKIKCARAAKQAQHSGRSSRGKAEVFARRRPGPAEALAWGAPSSCAFAQTRHRLASALPARPMRAMRSCVETGWAPYDGVLARVYLISVRIFPAFRVPASSPCPPFCRPMEGRERRTERGRAQAWP